MGIVQLTNADEGNDTREAGARRTYRASDGVVWCVRERAAGLGQQWPAGSSLVFESEMVIRRVLHYPPGWLDLTDEELERLSWLT